MKSQGPVAVILIIALVAVGVIAYTKAEALTFTQQEILFDLLIIAGTLSLYCFIVGELTNNVSQVDKLWSIAPIIYAGYTAYASNFEIRTCLVAVLIAIWGVRLSYNFARRGGYSWKFWTGEEDYRWEVLRNDPKFKNRWVWALFNFGFISGYQMALILYFTLPILLTVDPALGSELGVADYLITLAMIGFIIIETIADQQQYTFQSQKHGRMKMGEKLSPPYDKGFITTGLWSRMRHPNYMAEQGVWACVYAFSIVATGAWINWSIGGVFLLMILFRGSSDFSESISASKYPAYLQYQKEVSRFLPF
ncbi:MAG: DUF1295 domain-containing protein [Saprospiraceae bacterium]|nr:DUF1295 domain-containing protein [Saprospiraceae bacterium]